MTASSPKTHTINAAGKKLGRVATEAATFLIGKHSADFTRNQEGEVRVVIENASKLVISEKKREQETVKRYSGYPGGLKEEKIGHLAKRRGYGEVLRHAIKGMLPKNRLQTPRLNRLSISE